MRTPQTTSANPAWTNQPLVLYHGTLDIHVDSILSRIDLDVTDNDSDFGRGFYTTTSQAQATIFAEHARRRNTNRNVSPAVIEFIIDRNVLAQLESLWFVRHAPDANDFWMLVESCRKMGTSNRIQDDWYDVVVGPVASFYQSRTAWKDYDQISFHTDKAIEILDNSKKKEV